MTNMGPCTAQQRLKVLDKHVDQIAARLEASAVGEGRSDINKGQARPKLGGGQTIGTGGPRVGGGRPGNGWNTRTPSGGGLEPQPGVQRKGDLRPITPPKAQIVHPDPEILTDFDRIAREHLLIWLAISLALLSITLGLPYVMELF